jgi:hypothetical protein
MRYHNIKKYYIKAIFCTFLLSFVLSGTVSSQDVKEKKVKTVQVTLTVTDENGEALPQAQVIVGEGLIHAETDENGATGFAARPNEIVTIILRGFEKKVTTMAAIKGLPPQGGRPQNSPKTAPTIRGILSPHAGTRCFPRLLLLKIFERSQNISDTL